MNNRDIFRAAYALFQDTQNEVTDADIIMVLHGAIQSAYSQGFMKGYEERMDDEAQAQAQIDEAVEIGEQLLRDLDAIDASSVDSFFSDHVNRSDLTLDEVEEARGPVGNAYDHSEGHDFSVSSNGDTVSMRLVPRFPSAMYTR